MEELIEDCNQAMGSGGIMLTTTESIETRQGVKCQLNVSQKQMAVIHAEVVFVNDQVNPKQVGLELKENWQDTLEALLTQEEKTQKWGKDSESVYHKIQTMSSTEKIQLAVRCGKEERRILMKDAHHQVHRYLLKNPKITSDEIAQMCRSFNISSEMLIDIANNLDWMKQGSIRMSVVKNPKTPLNVVKKHIHSLNDNDLYMLARSEHVREAVSRLAKSVLASKGKRVD